MSGQQPVENGGQPRRRRRQQPRRPPRGSEGDQSKDADIVQMILDADLEDQTKQMLINYVGSDLVLSNFSDAELHEVRKLLESRPMLIQGEHPPTDSIYQGRLRKVAYDDPRREENALSAAQERAIDEIIQVAKSRATRGKGGWQQEELDTDRKEIRREQVVDSTGRRGDSGGELF